MAASYVLGTSSLVKGSMLDFTSAPLASLVSNPLQASLDCANFEVQNSGRVNTSILETEQIQLKPGSLLTSITLGESVLATSSCDFINFTKAGAVSLGCAATAQLTVGNPAQGAGVVFDCSADTVVITGPVAAQLSQVGQATIEAAGGTPDRVAVADTAITAASKVFVQVQGAAPDATATSFAVLLSDGVGFDIVANAAATADTVLDYFIAAY
jgi:hypothetical protein